MKKPTTLQGLGFYHYALLRAAHLRAAKRLGLTIGNMGWVVDRDAYLSKTSGGILQTLRLGHGRYEHTIV